MPIRLLCPNCRQPLTVADHLGGKRINCPKCKNLVQVPAQDSPAPAAAPVPSSPAPSFEDDLQLNIPGQQQTRHEETVKHKRCPGCGRDVPESTVLCTGCGYDFKTGQRRKGFQMEDPERRKRIFDSIVRNGFFVLILAIAVGGIYYAYKKGLFNPPTQEQQAQQEEKKETESADARKPKKKEPPKKQEDNKNSLLVVTNNRFNQVVLFADGERIGEVGFRGTEKIRIPAPEPGKTVTLTFDAPPPKGQKLPEAVSAALAKGVPFAGTTKQGTRIVFPGPDLAPEPDEVLPHVLVDLEVIKDTALNVGLISSAKYKDCVLKPVAPQTKLHLAYGKSDTKTVVKWIVQEVIVEQGGKKVYEPRPIPFEKSSFEIVLKDGSPDVKE